MSRLRFPLQGAHPAAMLPQRLPHVCAEHHRADAGRRDAGAEPSLGQLGLRLPGHGQDESVQRDGQRLRLLHAVPAQVPERRAGLPASPPPAALLPHLPAVPPERLSGRARAAGFPTEPAAGVHRGALSAESRLLFLLLFIWSAQVSAVRPEPRGRHGDVRAVRRVLLRCVPAAVPPVPRAPRQTPPGAAAEAGSGGRRGDGTGRRSAAARGRAEAGDVRGSRGGELQHVLLQLQGSGLHQVSGGGEARKARRETAGRDVEAAQSEWTPHTNISIITIVNTCPYYFGSQL